MSFSPSTTTSSAGIALRSWPFSALRDVVLEEIGERVIIHGTVNSYYLKQIAQEAVIPSLDGRILENQIQVIKEKAG
jgi:hypothetical protein